ncbi:MAG: class I SAM-dependent methyltransferase [Acidimicrobiia bacterium]
MSVHLRTSTGELVPLPVDRWLGPPTPEEESVLDRVAGPTLDVGCGPGRHVLALARRGVISLGIDVAGSAVELARHRGAPVLERSVFDRVPGAGRWGSALLLDGNVGIGGDPVALLRRVRALMRPGGRLLVEVEGPGTGAGRGQARLEVAGRPGPWFPWARVETSDVQRLAARSDCTLMEQWQEGRRWFARLDTR